MDSHVAIAPGIVLTLNSVVRAPANVHDAPKGACNVLAVIMSVGLLSRVGQVLLR